MGQENEIVFEDLHGVNDDEPVTVDLDARTKDDGITRTPADQVADDDVGNDDDIQIDGLRTADQDDAVLEPDKDDDASKAGEDDDYSKRVKARIQRATRGEKRAKQEAAHYREEATKLAKENYDRDKQTHERTIKQADTLIETTQDQLEAAIEAGNTKDQVRLTSLLTDQKAAKIQAEVGLDNLSPDGNVQPFSGRVDDTSSDQQTKAAGWMESRNDWYGANGFERQTRLANRLDKEVHADGYDVNSDEYFEELDRRIKEKEPKLYDDTAGDDDANDKDKGKGKRRRSPVAPVDSGNDGHRQRKSSNKVQLGEADFANMRRFNLDPNDPEVLKEYARNKQESDSGANQ